MHRPPKVPTILFERRRERGTWRWAAGSVLLHGLVVFALVWDWSGMFEMHDLRTPGGSGPVGGGGGGGSRQVSLIELPPYYEVARETPPTPPQERPEDLLIPPPELVQVEVETPVFEVPRVSNPLDAGLVQGLGAGTGGGPGAGTGSGGGIGSGQGTGVGSGAGPGSGGEGGDIFPPAPRYTILPPQPRPKSVQGRTYYARFVVGADGRVEEVEIRPEIRDGEYRRRLVAQLYEWSFAPALTREGLPVRGVTVVTFTL